jgi:hypothetical protein
METLRRHIMKYRSLALGLLVLAMTLWMGSAVLAVEDKGNTHDGTVVKAGDGKLTMTSTLDKKEHTHNVAADAKITLDGKACKLEDLKEGFTVKVTTKKDDPTTAVRIAGKSKDKK